MPTLLQLDSSADATGSVSRAVTTTFADTWTGLGDDHVIIRRDLHADPLPHLADASLHWPARLRSPGATPPADAEALQQQIIHELISVDAVVIGAPMYNYSLPSVLKVWLDYIHIPGVTTPFDNDAQPMAGKPAVIISSRGGIYDPGSANADWDHTVPPLQIILGNALGMDVSVIKVSRTLSGVVPGMAGEADRAAEELRAGHQRAAELARKIG
ncbi:FMN-dependent NADH-azoreductase [Microlunatus endophyticus]|uniref:FMN dependent NADH:quinone oxidoreductase n=1 Tax=Microlunatus endophyticus TaxID=1716077 RepID=A0A917W2R0_9ACTN|nr:NAD(P)H-dependent oxidoreductase [Microlunatus endophyticus]GGL62025.1 FMN-dependent NADH-azoreductase [Microlunatus endophyticus]